MWNNVRFDTDAKAQASSDIQPRQHRVISFSQISGSIIFWALPGAMLIAPECMKLKGETSMNYILFEWSNGKF
jgi:hypothetical protein